MSAPKARYCEVHRKHTFSGTYCPRGAITMDEYDSYYDYAMENLFLYSDGLKWGAWPTRRPVGSLTNIFTPTRLLMIRTQRATGKGTTRRATRNLMLRRWIGRRRWWKGQLLAIATVQPMITLRPLSAPSKMRLDVCFKSKLNWEKGGSQCK